jgi:hypothetical protein
MDLADAIRNAHDGRGLGGEGNHGGWGRARGPANAALEWQTGILGW